MENTDSIAESTFNRFYPQFAEDEQYDLGTILFNLLPSFFEELAEAWGEKCSLHPYRTSDKINDSKPLFEFFTDFNASTFYVMTCDGSLYTAKSKTYKSGGQTWNGDDEYFDNYKTDYIDVKPFAVIENMKDIKRDNITAEKMEMLAAEIVSTICQG